MFFLNCLYLKWKWLRFVIFKGLKLLNLKLGREIEKGMLIQNIDIVQRFLLGVVGGNSR